MINEDQYREGIKMYYESHGKYSNPYLIGSSEHNQFERGWTQSLKRDNGRLAQSQYQSSYNRDTSSKLTTPSVSSELTAELYRSRKG